MYHHDYSSWLSLRITLRGGKRKSSPKNRVIEERDATTAPCSLDTWLRVPSVAVLPDSRTQARSLRSPGSPGRAAGLAPPPGFGAPQCPGCGKGRMERDGAACVRALGTRQQPSKPPLAGCLQLSLVFGSVSRATDRVWCHPTPRLESPPPRVGTHATQADRTRDTRGSIQRKDPIQSEGAGSGSAISNAERAPRARPPPSSCVCVDFRPQLQWGILK